MAQIYAFLELQGIDGESTDQEYSDKIEVQSIEWGSSNNSSFEHGTGSSIGVGAIHDITCAKYTDKASLNLHKYCVTGKVIPSGQVTLLKLQDQTKIAYFKVKLTNIVVTSWNIRANGDGQLPMEHFTLHFVKSESTYLPQGDSGDPAGNVDFNWDIQTNAG